MMKKSNDRKMAELLIYDLAQQHRKTWLGRTGWQWYLGLLEEVLELGLSLLGLHKDSPEHELCQIGAIAVNWVTHGMNSLRAEDD